MRRIYFGCIATGKSLEEVKANTEQAIKLRIEGMVEDREPLPVAHSIAEYLDIPVPGSAA